MDQRYRPRRPTDHPYPRPFSKTPATGVRVTLKENQIGGSLKIQKVIGGTSHPRTCKAPRPLGMLKYYRSINMKKERHSISPRRRQGMRSRAWGSPFEGSKSEQVLSLFLRRCFIGGPTVLSFNSSHRMNRGFPLHCRPTKGGGSDRRPPLTTGNRPERPGRVAGVNMHG